MLTQSQWTILDTLADGQEPIEQVYLECSYDFSSYSPTMMLVDIFQLQQAGWICITQQPLTVFGQKFRTKQITSDIPRDIVGDLGQEFAAFSKSRDYARYADGAGIPMGIWLEMTPEGKVEWEDAKYELYWYKEES